MVERDEPKRGQWTEQDIKARRCGEAIGLLDKVSEKVGSALRGLPHALEGWDTEELRVVRRALEEAYAGLVGMRSPEKLRSAAASVGVSAEAVDSLQRIREAMRQ